MGHQTAIRVPGPATTTGDSTRRRGRLSSLAVGLTLGAAATLLVAQPWEHTAVTTTPAAVTANDADAANALARDRGPVTATVGSTTTTAANALARDRGPGITTVGSTTTTAANAIAQDRAPAPVASGSSAADAANAIARDRAPRPLVGAAAADAANALRQAT